MRAHAELIKQWAEDETLEIEFLFDLANNKWEPAPNPTWMETALYREKPKEKTKVEMWQWVVAHGGPPGKVIASEFYKNTDFLREHYLPDYWKIICRIEGSKIEVEE